MIRSFSTIRHPNKPLPKKFMYNVKLAWDKFGVGKMRWLPQDKNSSAAIQKIESQGYQIEDMFTSVRYKEEILRETDYYPDEKWVPPVDLDSFKPVDESTISPQPVPRMAYGWPPRMENGVQQAALLTNSIVKNNSLPKQHLDLLSKLDDLSDDELLRLQQSVLRSHIWQSDYDKLPKRFQKDQGEKKHVRANWGVFPTNIVRYLFEDLFRMAESRNGFNSKRLEIRQHQLKEKLRLWQGAPVHFSEAHDIAVFGDEPLPVLCTPESDIDFDTKVLSTMKPMSPLIDVQVLDRYNADAPVTLSGIPSESEFRFRYPHLVTLNLALPNTWSDFTEPETRPVQVEQRGAAMMMSAYCQAAASARQRFGDAVVDGSLNEMADLPEPVVVQVVASDGINFDFCCFQMNTLRPIDGDNDLEESVHAPDTVRNRVWLDLDNRLVEKVLTTDLYLLDGSFFRNLDPSVFKKLLAVHSFGS